VDCNDPIEESDKDKDQKPKSEIVKERIEIPIADEKQQQADEKDSAARNRRDKPFAQPKPGLAQLADIVAEPSRESLDF
jgi:hypothetical protein